MDSDLLFLVKLRVSAWRVLGKETALNTREEGFSLIELLVVVAVVLVIAAIAAPNIQRMQVTYKLDSSGHAIAGLLQQARVQAVRTNQPAYAQFDPTQSPTLVFTNSDPTLAYVPGNPDVTVSGGVAIQTVGLPDHSQLDAYLGVPAGGPSGVIVEVGTPIGFNARGLPCVSAVANPAVCLQQDAGKTPAFLWLMTNGPGNWEAVTVTAAGRTKSWRMTSNGTGSCGYTACWQ